MAQLPGQATPPKTPAGTAAAAPAAPPAAAPRAAPKHMASNYQAAQIRPAAYRPNMTVQLSGQPDQASGDVDTTPGYQPDSAVFDQGNNTTTS